jgi:hypothetical protein
VAADLVEALAPAGLELAGAAVEVGVDQTWMEVVTPEAAAAAAAAPPPPPPAPAGKDCAGVPGGGAVVDYECVDDRGRLSPSCVGGSTGLAADACADGDGWGDAKTYGSIAAAGLAGCLLCACVAGHAYTHHSRSFSPSRGPVEGKAEAELEGAQRRAPSTSGPFDLDAVAEGSRDGGVPAAAEGGLSSESGPQAELPRAPERKLYRVSPNCGPTLGSNRDFQSKCWAKSRNLGKPCTIFVSGGSRRRGGPRM